MADTKTTAPPQQKSEDNPKIVAPAGTVPTVAQAPGASPPHPMDLNRIDTTNDTPEVAEARGRAIEGAEALADEEHDAGAWNAPISFRPDEKAKPIQCIARVKFQAPENGGYVVQEGQTYFYKPLLDDEDKPLDPPFEILEPVDPKVAAQWAKATREKRLRKREQVVFGQRQAGMFMQIAHGKLGA